MTLWATQGRVLTDSTVLYTVSPDARSFALPRIPDAAAPSARIPDVLGQ